MKILALSDIHLDSYRIAINSSSCDYIGSIIGLDTIKGIDAITVAGDIGHCNKDNKYFIKYLRDRFKVPVIFTFGNHDLYLINRDDYSKYEGSSFNRLDDMISWADTVDDIYCLDGDTITIGSVVFGGVAGWYDGSYGSKGIDANTLWKTVMNDSIFIYEDGYRVDNYTKILNKLKPKEKIDKVLSEGCTYLITHVCPIINDKLIKPVFKRSPNTCFYYSSYLDIGSSDSLQTIQFGHIHTQEQAVVDGINFFSSPIGYFEESNNKVMVVDV